MHKPKLFCDRSLARLVSLFGILLLGVVLFNHVYGIWNKYTPVPFWDAWVSYGVIPDLSGLSYVDYFFSRHNGSHILLSHRFTEIIDWKLFRGSQVFTTFSLAICPIILSWLYFRRIAKPIQSICAGAIVVGLMLSWVQWENFRWPFQDQMYFVLIFAYIAILSKEKYVASGSFSYIGLFCASALLAIFSMGNGVLVPLICAAASMASIFIFKTHRRRNSYLLMAALLCLGIWFAVFHGGGTGVPERKTVDVTEVLFSTLALVGSPLHIVFGCGKNYAALFGGLLIGLIGYLSWKSACEECSNTYVAYVAFLLASCLAAIYARYVEFSGAWETSRYQGITMSIWALTFIEVINRNVGNKKARVAVSLFMMLIVLSSIIKFYGMQYENLAWERFEKSMGVLSLMNHIDDEKELNTFFPWYKEIDLLTTNARSSCSGVFSNKLFLNACLNKQLEIPEASSELNVNVVKYEEVANVYRLFALIHCPPNVDSLKPAVLAKNSMQVHIILGKDSKNFGENCRLGGYMANEKNLSEFRLVVDGNAYYLRDQK